VKPYLTQSRAAGAEVNSEPERFIIAGNRMVLFVYARVRPKGNDIWQDVSLADGYPDSNHRVGQMQAFADRQEGLRWVGAKVAQDR
jgi:hypothetical protein